VLSYTIIYILLIIGKTKGMSHLKTYYRQAVWVDGCKPEQSEGQRQWEPPTVILHIIPRTSFLNFIIDFWHKRVCIEKRDIDFYTFRESIKSFDPTKIIWLIWFLEEIWPALFRQIWNRFRVRCDVDSRFWRRPKVVT